MAAHADRAPSPESPDGLSRTEIAESLLTRRDALLRQLLWQIKVSRFLNEDQHESVIDEAVDYLVTQNEGRVIADHDALERAFWKVVDLRVRQDILIFQALVGARLTGTGDPSDPITAALGRIRQLGAVGLGGHMSY